MKMYDVYPVFDINVVRGQGCHVWDDKGTEYLDLYGGHAVISIGHTHPRYVSAITEQIEKIGFYSNSVINRLQQGVADRLGKLSGYDDYQLFLVNSGAEANENSLKLASFHTGKTRVLALDGSFHGRTSLAVEVTDNLRITAPINDNGHTTFLPLNDIAAFRREIEKGDVAAVIVECVQGVGGIRMLTDDFLQQLSELCSTNGVVLVCDEVQCGYGRTGLFFAHQSAGIRPDIITMAKGMGNGFPIGGIIVSPKFVPIFGQLGTTFGGNHLACAAATAVLDVIKEEGLIKNAVEVGEYLINELRGLPGVKEVRGRGLMIGIEMKYVVKDLRSRLVHEGHVFTGASGNSTIRLLPPLSLTKEEASCFLSRFSVLLS